ncbi:MAG: arsenate reductase ArsC [Candidatus Methanoperedens sp.]|nr:arsenate reductase ArsC [Candidatus Methanoperedens sp.]
MRKVLFVCVENACRSQMAEAFFNKYAKNTIAYSAGSAPAENIDPKTVELMKEKGIDLTNKKTTNFNSLPIENFDFIITMGCRDVCPITPKEKTIKWDIECPKGLPTQKYRDVRDLIETKVKRLIKELEIDG